MVVSVTELLNTVGALASTTRTPLSATLNRAVRLYPASPCGAWSSVRFTVAVPPGPTDPDPTRTVAFVTASGGATTISPTVAL